MSKKKKTKKVSEITRYFLADEFKPSGANSLWSAVLEPGAYDVKIGYIHGSLGIISYNPKSYAILEIDEEMPPVMGYSFCCTEKNSLDILFKIKGWLGWDAFSFHNKRLVRVYTDESGDNYEDCFCFQLNSKIIEFYASIERVNMMWDEKDEKQIELLQKIGGGED